MGGGSKLWAEVSDDGRGFDPAGVPPAGHQGIAAMRGRADLLGGRLEIRSRAGAGTTTRFEADLTDGSMGRV